ncbi:MAG: GAF domain-containing protein [Candidatus Eisenbacteria bacterium]|nr:GAF domain-containing protein [Candidatus Eisenbacteria bacterium]
MSRKKPDAPSAEFLKLKRELDHARREIMQHKKGIPSEAGAGAPGDAGLREQVTDLEQTRDRLSKLYFGQIEENRKRAQKLHHILHVIGDISRDLDPDTLLQRIALTIREHLGFRIVLIRVRESGTQRLKACAFAGLSEEARASLEAEDVELDDFHSWLKDEFKVSRSFFISHKASFSRILPRGYTADLGQREEWEWHEDDVLLVPLYNRQGELTAYFSVDDPVDRMVPGRETVELLEIFGNHALVAIENARLYRQLEDHSRELEAASQRMKEMSALKSNFVATVSHELRTPLTAIRAYVDTLLGAGEGLAHDQLTRFLTIINEESQRLARLIESVLDLNRFDSGHPHLRRQQVDMVEVVRETAGLLDPVGQAGQVSLKIVTETADTAVDADRDQMRQLVLHLGSNAVKFTPPGGTTTFRISGDARFVTLQVEDTGIGIPEQALERIFERFYQVDSSLVRRYGGTGLGLAICKSIVEWHGGRVFATSQPGQGSCFTAVLPRRMAPRVVVRETPALPPATEDVLKLAVEMVAEVMDARVVSLMACQAEGELIVQAAIGLEERIVQNARIRAGQGVAGRVLEQRRPVCMSRAGGRDDVPPSGRQQYRTGTFIAVPIEGADGLLGVLNVTDPVSQKPFGAEDCHLLLDLAERVAIAWQQARSLESNREGAHGATTTLRQLLQHAARGRGTAPDRVRMARATAREMRLTEAEIGVVGYAATVHDVGMTMVTGDAIERGEKLSPEEREEMERHVELGAELLEPLEAVGAVREIVLSHHEWWDGTGYPRRLRGDEIPVGARVLGVVDAFESMTLGRAHRRAQSREEALEEIRRRGGTQFDPDVVEAFERALPAVDAADRETESRDAADSATSERGR